MVEIFLKVEHHAADYAQDGAHVPFTKGYHQRTIKSNFKHKGVQQLIYYKFNIGESKSENKIVQQFHSSLVSSER